MGGGRRCETGKGVRTGGRGGIIMHANQRACRFLPLLSLLRIPPLPAPGSFVNVPARSWARGDTVTATDGNVSKHTASWTCMTVCSHVSSCLFCSLHGAPGGRNSAMENLSEVHPRSEDAILARERPTALYPLPLCTHFASATMIGISCAP